MLNSMSPESKFYNYSQGFKKSTTMKYIIFILSVLVHVCTAFAQPTFINVYDSAKMTYPRDIVFNELGDIFVCTMAWEWNDYHYNNSIYKFDESGNLLKTWWEKDLSMYFVEGTRLMLVDDELYLFGFVDTSEPDQVNPAVFMKKFDQELNEISSFIFYLDSELFTGIHHLGRVKFKNDNFIFFSSIYTVGAEPLVTPFYMEIGKDGQLKKIVYDNTPIKKHFCNDFTVKENNNGFFVYVTEISYYNEITGHIYDYDINLENLVKYPLECGFRQFFSVVPEYNEVVYLSGSYYSMQSYRQPGVMQITNSGEVLNSFLFIPQSDSLSYTSYYNSLDKLSDGNLILCSTYGVINQFIPQNAPSWISLFKLSSDLELLWHRYIGGGANYEAYTMRVAPDDGIVICAGYSPVPPTSMIIKDLMVIKTDSDGLTTSLNDENPAVITTEAILFPNPAGDFVIVDFSLLYQTATLQLTDLAGRTVFERALTANHQQVNISGVPAGAYVYRIFNNKGLEESGKLVVE
jgi:hypothetical protein